MGKTPSHTPEMIAMARKIVKRFYPEMPDNYSGRRLQIALAAIKETTERAARLGANRGWAPHKYAAALRNGEHYHD